MVKHAQVFWTIETNTYQSHFMSNVWSLPINNLIAFTCHQEYFPLFIMKATRLFVLCESPPLSSCSELLFSFSNTKTTSSSPTWAQVLDLNFYILNSTVTCFA